MDKEYYSRPHSSSRIWLNALTREAEDRAADLGPLAGPVRELQKPWSLVVDQLQAERQQELETPRRVAA